MRTMKLSTLIEMLEVGNIYNSKRVNELLLQLAVDPELDDDVTIDSFSNEFYDVRSLGYIKQCFDFRIK